MRNRSKSLNKNGSTAIAASNRRGMVVIWFAIFIFAILPIMALVVHLGMVTLSRRQMQASVNSAAIEGLRLSDSSTDAVRRSSVSNLVQSVYDDNLLSDSSDEYQLGAGGVIQFESSPDDPTLPGTSFRPSASITESSIGVYAPSPESNTSNSRHGDQVSGQYKPAANHEEESDYARNDFLLSGDGDYDSSVGDDAYLVRLRRTAPNNVSVPGIDNEANVSSTGNTVPYLFGRAILGGAEFLDRRERGTIVRATAIAQKQPALRVGIRNPLPNPENVDMMGAINVQMDIDLWLAGTPVSVGDADHATQAQVVNRNEVLVVYVGQHPFSNNSNETIIDPEGYVILTDDDIPDGSGSPEPILTQMGNVTRRIVGFAKATGVSIQDGMLNFTPVTPQPVAPQNASANITPPSDDSWNIREDASWDPLQLQTLFDSISAHAGNGSLLWAPALRRTVR